MAKKEAYCTKCGSLIQVDDTKPTIKCIFCESEINTQQSLGLNNDPDSRQILQQQVLEQSKKEKEEKKHQKSGSGKTHTESAKASKAPPAKKVREITVVKPLPLRIKLTIVGVSILIIAVFAAIFVPLVSSRDAKRTALEQHFDTGFSIGVEDFAFNYHNNRELWLVTKDEVDETIALRVFDEYYAIYETEYPSSAPKVKTAMKLRIYAPAGLFLCQYRNGTVLCDFSTADPTPTPGITTAIGK